MDTVPPVIEPMQVDYDMDVDAEEPIPEPEPEPPIANEDHLDFQVTGPTCIELDSFLKMFEGQRHRR